MNLGFMFLPIYRGWVVVFFAGGVSVDLVPDRAATRLGAYLARGKPKNPTLVRAFRYPMCPRMITLDLRALASASPRSPACCLRPIKPGCGPLMGADLIIVVFRRGGDRRHGFDHGFDHHRGFALGNHRRPDQVFLFIRRLPNTVVFCPDGAGAVGQTIGTDRTGDLT